MPFSIACAPNVSGKRFHTRPAQAAQPPASLRLVDKGVFAKLGKLALDEHNELVDLDWR